VTVDKLREVPGTQPFKPFTIHVADGRDVPLAHPEFVSVDPEGCVMHVFQEDGRSKFIDFVLVTGIELGGGKPRRGRRRDPWRRWMGAAGPGRGRTRVGAEGENR